MTLTRLERRLQPLLLRLHNQNEPRLARPAPGAFPALIDVMASSQSPYNLRMEVRATPLRGQFWRGRRNNRKAEALR
jgi:hypothetical protein